MKTILVPTDFSKVADNAINYATEIAKLTKAKLILFHAYHVPVVTTEVPIVMPSLDELEKDCMEGLLKISTRLHSKLSTTNIECVVKCGFAVEEINQYASEIKADLVVMGMQGAGSLTERLIGSVTTSLLRESKCPVLAIVQKVKFKAIKKIVLACDYQEMDKSALASLNEIASLYKSHIYVLNVANEAELCPPIPVAVKDFLRLEDTLENVDHTVHCIENENVVEGINEFVSEHHMDMVVMIPRKHSFLQNIFNEPNTKRMAFHANVPLLTLH
ncbi:MAG: universal stress protein [Bacteroidota bacterium]